MQHIPIILHVHRKCTNTWKMYRKVLKASNLAYIYMMSVNAPVGNPMNVQFCQVMSSSDVMRNILKVLQPTLGI